MTATMLARTAAAPYRPAPSEAERIEALLDWVLLVDAGWDGDRESFEFPQGHPSLGWAFCRRADCQSMAKGPNRLCTTCDGRFRRSPMSIDEFVTVPNTVVRTRTRAWEGLCLVCRTEGHQRPVFASKLCRACSNVRWGRGQSVDAYVAGDARYRAAAPRPSLGECTVGSCHRLTAWAQLSMCFPHGKTWRAAGLVDIDLFRRTAPPVSGDRLAAVWVGGLPTVVFHQVMYGIQRAIADGRQLRRPDIKAACAALRKTGVGDIRDADSGEPFIKFAVTELAVGLGDRDAELGGDVWNLRLWGRGNTILDFRPITYPWLRQATKQWIEAGLAKERPTGRVQQQLGSLTRFSEHLNRVAPFARPSDLDRAAKDRFLAELRLDEDAGRITTARRARIIRHLAQFLRESDGKGCTDPGGPLHGMSGSFRIGRDEAPKVPSTRDPEDEVGKSLPEAIVAQLLGAANLGVISPAWQRLVRISIDTGRRPEEVCGLRLECLDYDVFVDHDGVQDRQPVLVHDQPKVSRTRVRLPITADTAATIEEQQVAVRAKYPGTAPDQLPLFPATTKNPFGTKACSTDSYSSRMKRWRNNGMSLFEATIRDGTIEPLLDAAGEAIRFPNNSVFAYAFRHTYAQRHIDAGVAVSVLAELMGHSNINTTQAYYRIRTQQKREALEMVTRFSITARGAVMTGPSSPSQTQRVELGSVGVPMGSCVESSNVKAHGRACPFRHRCFGCAHFRTDLSHLPDLRAYLNQLLVAREELADANPDIAEWARTDAMPTDEEVATVRGLVDACERLLDQLPPEERQELLRHIETLREARQHLVEAVPVAFLNTIAQPAPTLFPALERQGSFA